MKSRKELERTIDKRIRWVVEYAYKHSPYYHELFKERGLTPSDIKGREDLKKIPITTKKELIEGQPPKGDFSFFSRDPKNRKIFRFYTSGTKGLPKILALSEQELDLVIEISKRAFEMAGIRRGDVVLNCYPIGINASGMLTVLTFASMGVEQISAGVSPFPPKLSLIKTHKPRAMTALTSYADRLAREISLQGVDPSTLGIEVIVVAGEASTRKKRERIAEEFNAEVYNLYGTTEGRMPLAMECSEHNLHVMEDGNYLMLYDPKTGDFIENEGEKGVDVMTTLNYVGKGLGTPLINYSHGDTFEFISDKCGCGSIFRVISDVWRADDAIVISGAKIDPAEIEAVLHEPENFKRLTGEWEMLVDFDEEERVYDLLLRIEARGKPEEELGEKVKRELMELNYPLANETSMGRIRFRVEVVGRGGLELYKVPGKPKRISDKRKS